MKKYIFLFIACFSICNIVAQKQNVLCRLVILEARINNVDYSDFYLQNEAYLALYLTEERELYFANVMSKKDSQSFGRVSSMEHKNIPETMNSYEADVFRFRWSYNNTYDNKKGSCLVEMTVIYKEQANSFEVTMIQENMDVNIYKGYVEGTLNLNNYLR